MFFYFVKTLVFVYLRIFYRIKVIGAENIPEKGGFIFCSNHINAQDPLVIGTSIKRKLYCLSKKELFKNKFFGAVLKRMGALPVNRNAPDIAAYRQSLEILEKGNALCIFAQGTRYKESDDISAKSGVALFALKADVPVVPVGISSNYKLFSKITLKFGPPLDLEEYRGQRIKTELLESAKEHIMSKVFELCKK